MSVEILKMRVKAMLHVRLWQQVYDLCYKMRDYSSKCAAVWKELRVLVAGFQPPNMTSQEDKVAVGRVRMGVESTMMSRFGRVGVRVVYPGPQI